MLTKLKVSGFKNLWNVDVRFGPFTCIAGANGVGKSNLFDAICFLSSLSHSSLMEAALSVRDEDGKTTDIKSLFSKSGDNIAPKMSFEAEMIIPYNGVDDLGQEAKATTTFVRYSIELGYRDEENRSSGNLELLKEELVHITQTDAKKHLLFSHSDEWRKSVVKGKRAGGKFISTDNGRIQLHQDGRSGKPSPRIASDMPRTVLSATTAETPTAALVKKEMQSWQLFQLEPSALRSPDGFSASSRLGSNGSHLPATLYRLAHPKGNGKSVPSGSQILSQVGNRLAQLIDEVHELDVDRDNKRELLTLTVRSRDGNPLAARSLSDGSLRFLALAVLVNDPEFHGLLCLEEPENGIHPGRIPAMLQLLQDIASDSDDPIGPDNPSRQVIINTHSPSVVQQVPEDCLLIAEWNEMLYEKSIIRGMSLSCLADTWRTKMKTPEGHEFPSCPIGKLMEYLNPVMKEDGGKDSQQNKLKTRRIRVIDRTDIQPYLPFMANDGNSI